MIRKTRPLLPAFKLWSVVKTTPNQLLNCCRTLGRDNCVNLSISQTRHL